MPGIKFFSDLYAFWVHEFSIFWDVLQTSVDEVLDNFTSPGIFSQAWASMLKGILDHFGFGDYTVLEFILSSMGAFFGIYFIIVVIKWFVDLVS